MSEKDYKAKYNRLAQDNYDPDAILQKVSALQHVLLDAAAELNPQELLDDPKKMEQINSLTNNMGSMALKRKQLAVDEQQANNLGALADALVDSLVARNIDLTGRNEGGNYDVPDPSSALSQIQTEGWSEDMLARGHQTTDFDDFATKHNLHRDE